MKFGVVIFPGSNCDHDCYYAIESVVGKPVEFIWHQDTSVKGFDAVILPGGFAYGDYLRTGALAKFSPVMKAVGDFANFKFRLFQTPVWDTVLVHADSGALGRRFAIRWPAIGRDRGLRC